MRLCLTVIVLLIGRLAAAADTYAVHFQARFDPDAGRVRAVIDVRQSAGQLKLLDLSAPATRYEDFRGDGTIEREGERLVWIPPPQGGILSYAVIADHRRGSAYDARLTADWAVMRLDDVFPPARVVTAKAAESRATLELDGPRGWTFETRYGRYGGRLPVANPHRRFDRPTGWLSAGRQGVRREWIGEYRVAIAGPRGHDLRRLDIIAFLRWTLPEFVSVFPEFPATLLVVGARDGMWRGALSGPDSVYLHADRPLVSGNGTSTLLHELVHVVTGAVRGPREDWIVEGLAEYYSIEILHRSGGLGAGRYLGAFEWLADWSHREQGALKSPSSGADTARAALLFRDLDAELRHNGGAGLDPVARRLIGGDRITATRLTRLAEQALGAPSKVLAQALADADEAPR